MKMYISSVKGVSSVPAIQIQKRPVWATGLREGEAAVRRRRALRRVDRELEKGNYRAALSLVKQLQAHPAGLLRGFGAAAAKVPGTISSLDESKLTREIEISSLQLVVNAILDSVKCSLEFQLQEEEIEVTIQDFGRTVNAESNDSVYKDHLMCTHHEAGHFLVGYMLGVLPKRYKIPSVEDLLQDEFAGGNVEFVGFEFLRDVYGATMSKGKFTKKKLCKKAWQQNILFLDAQSYCTQTLRSWIEYISGSTSQRVKSSQRLGGLQKLLSQYCILTVKLGLG